MLKTIINGKSRVKVNIVTFLDAVATVDVLRASNNVANTLTCRNLHCTFCTTIKSSSRFERINKLDRD